MMVKVHLLKIEEMGTYKGIRTRYTFKELNSKNEKIVVELGHCDGNSSIAKEWKKRKWINNNLNSWVHVEVFATDEKGQCWGKYNPQDSNQKVNFNWVLEDTKQNRIRILSEISELAFAEL